jgi:hypothetical protein
MTVDTELQKFNLLVYAIERRGLKSLPDQIVDRNYTVAFEPLTTQRRFNEFDGVIMFQGTFESFEGQRDWKGGITQVHSCNRDELDKRKNELQLLLNKG